MIIIDRPRINVVASSVFGTEAGLSAILSRILVLDNLHRSHSIHKWTLIFPFSDQSSEDLTSSSLRPFFYKDCRIAKNPIISL
jgi:hypothetical protein